MAALTIDVLRYGHRDVRDYRVTTHCCLVARALGARKIIIEGTPDRGIKESVDGVTKRWGGGFKVEFMESWRSAVRKYKKAGFFIVHLTMYGLPIEKETKKLRKKGKILLIIGSQKVECDVYRLSDANISVTQQPHSEIGALAVALDGLQGGKELAKRFKGAKIRITPQPHGKKVLNAR
ncbi:MAG: tRNA (cytidine(56)-2'-O)-methyltransferase [Candidatus Diapherotrites archaeon]|nr:tRNA (cytidine(56)-2'-O)-methyltransferase [Candidatus Diapherotrites archaeon]